MTDKCYIDEKTYMSSKYTWSIAMDEIEIVLTLWLIYIKSACCYCIEKWYQNTDQQEIRLHYPWLRKILQELLPFRSTTSF